MSGIIFEDLTRGELIEFVNCFIDKASSLADYEKEFCKSLAMQLSKKNPSPKQLQYLCNIYLRHPLPDEILKNILPGEGSPAIKPSMNKKKTGVNVDIVEKHVYDLYTERYGPVKTLSDHETISEIIRTFPLVAIEQAFIEAEQRNKGFRWIVACLYQSEGDKYKYERHKKNYSYTSRKTGARESYYGQFFTNL